MRFSSHLFAIGTLAAPFLLGSCALVRVADSLGLNTVEHKSLCGIDDAARKLHGSMLVADMHADTLMLDRGGVTGIQKRHNYGHVDLPRLREGNVGFQVLTVSTVTPVPYSQNLNGGWILPNAQWLISPLQGWPIRAWFNSREHALYQAEKWRVNADGKAFAPILTQADLNRFLEANYRRAGNSWLPLDTQHQPVATVLGLEGSHALHLRESDSDAAIASKVAEFRAAGFRMLALTHRFDNDLAGASEGRKHLGVTRLGHRLLNEMERQGFICDLAHNSEACIADVLAQHPRLPVMVSHCGVNFGKPQGKQVAARLLSLKHARAIAQRGGVVGIGVWPEAIGDADPKLAAKMIRDCINDPKIGPKHVALGSDMDGAVKSAFAANHWALLTNELGDLPESTLRDVMGGNVIRFYQTNLQTR